MPARCTQGSHRACPREEVLRDPVRASGCEVRQAHVDRAGQGIIWQNGDEFSKLPSQEHFEPELGCEAAPCSGSGAPILAGNHGVERANGLARLQHGCSRSRFPCKDTLRRPGEHGCRRPLHAGDALPEEGRSLRSASAHPEQWLAAEPEGGNEKPRHPVEPTERACQQTVAENLGNSAEQRPPERGPPVGRGPPAQVGRGPPVELERGPPP